MCIRDSGNTVTVTETTNGDYYFQDENGTGSVSYTHLDVYKRQDETLYHGTLVADVHCYKNNFFEKILLKLGCLLYTSRCV